MQRNKIGVLILAVLIIASAIFGWREYYRKNEPVVNMTPAFIVTAEQIVKEFEANDSVPAKKYTGKLIAVSGNIKQVDKDEQGYFTVVLGSEGSMSSVRCAMDSLYASDVQTLQKGQPATIKGMFTGFQKDESGLLGSDIILNRCVIYKTQTKKQD
jgi:hypothetical protein